MSFLYETHLHTAHSSACGRSLGADYIRLYKEMGYAGMIVTDHFYNGNTAINRTLPWKEWVNQFCRGYEEARNEGERQNFDVFFGWEETFDGCDDYLVYGLNKEWLLDHPEVRTWSRGEQYRTVRAAGGCVVQAHPFRQHGYIKKVVLSTGCVDAVEAANVGNYEQYYDALAMQYANTLGLPVTAGSDMHDAQQICSGSVFGVVVKERLKTIADYVNVILNNDIVNIHISGGRCDSYGDEKITIPLDIRDENDRSTGKKWEDFLLYRRKKT